VYFIFSLFNILGAQIIRVENAHFARNSLIRES